MFVSKVALAACGASTPDYKLLRPALVELKGRYPGGLGKCKESVIRPSAGSE